jgi:hypothetical protein
MHMYTVIPVIQRSVLLSPAPPDLPRILDKPPCAMAGSVVDNLSACHLIGSMFACTLYSAYVFAFVASIYFLFNVRGRRVKPNKIILAVSIIIFLCVTVARPASSLQVLHS